jgi:hypothetical protein
MMSSITTTAKKFPLIWRFILSVSVVGLSCFTAGCAGDRAARSLAGTLHKLTIEYEEEVTKKVTAEQAFYREQQDEILQRTFYNPPLQDYLDSEKQQKLDNDIKKTLLYGRLRVNNERDARITAERLIASPTNAVMGQTITFLAEGIQKDLEYYRELRARRTEVDSNLTANLVKLSGQRELLMSIRKRLSDLLIVPTPQEQIDLVVQFGKDIREQLESKTSSNQ